MLTQVEAGDYHDQLFLTFDSWLPDGFRVVALTVEPASNGDDCRPTEYRDALVAALKESIR